MGSRTDLLPPWRGTPGPASGDLEAIPRNLDETPDTGGILPRLSDANLDLLADEGNIEFTHDGQVLFERYGNDNDDLYVVLSGAVAIAEYARNATPEISVHERGRFLGEADLLTRQASSRTAVVIRPGRVARLDRAQQQVAFRRDSRLRDVIVRTLLLRRSRLLAEVADLRVLGVPEADETRALTDWATAHGRTIGVDDVRALLTDADLDALGLQPDNLPLVFTRSGELLTNPGPEELTRAFPPRRTPESPPAEHPEHEQ
ncbi:MAG: cyclic nucleotide-binding domain-containing protein [Rhodococcus sp. (in: high G+C Gram-positive bacteria)]|uniref:Crp/Fnr family transcriptional regulator n=1 Tax=Rhodococcus sp. TaxID=1831 RepID=UPI003BB7C3E3